MEAVILRWRGDDKVDSPVPGTTSEMSDNKDTSAEGSDSERLEDKTNSDALDDKDEDEDYFLSDLLMAVIPDQRLEDVGQPIHVLGGFCVST
ncbi:MAG: hypothetical protein U0892_08105 [Pirellulales bacterium]